MVDSSGSQAEVRHDVLTWPRAPNGGVSWPDWKRGVGLRADAARKGRATHRSSPITTGR